LARWHQAATLLLTSPGVPLLFQGQERYPNKAFSNAHRLDWSILDQHTFDIYKRLLRLRRNNDGHTRGLLGAHTNVLHCNEAEKVLAYQRWSVGGPGDDTVAVMNFSVKPQPRYRIGMPWPGDWKVEFNTCGQDGAVIYADFSPYDGQHAMITLSLERYSALILSRQD
ncbi:MAG TPA: alpha amylase C-terminal domain-containing protein, partial [Candidatus Baltobacteraceae bacterium]|nr:alpha amylase C-terminal domain-containing protein [Candidatus Baltobacteraceae bacterium]